MAKNTNPLTKSLLIKQNYKTITLPYTRKGGNNELIKDKNIKEIITGILLKLGILSSDIHLSKDALGNVQVKLAYYPLIVFSGFKNKARLTATQQSNSVDSNFGENSLKSTKQLLKVIRVLRLYFKLRYPKNTFKFVFIRAPHKFVEPKILNDYIHYSVVEDPNKIKLVLIRLIREYKKFYAKDL